MLHTYVHCLHNCTYLSGVRPLPLPFRHPCVRDKFQASTLQTVSYVERKQEYIMLPTFLSIHSKFTHSSSRSSMTYFGTLSKLIFFECFISFLKTVSSVTIFQRPTKFLQMSLFLFNFKSYLKRNLSFMYRNVIRWPSN